MKRWIGRIVLVGAVLAVAGIAFAWSVLAIPYFSDLRSKFVSKLLTEQIGQLLLVNGDVSVLFGPVSRVRASGVRIPSENMADVDLAKLENLEFDINLMSLLDGRIDLNNLLVDGLQVELIKLEDDTKSWNEREEQVIGSKAIQATDAPAPKTTKEDDDSLGLLAFLRTRTVAFTNIRLVTDDQQSGFEYDFELTELSLNQLDDGLTLGVTGSGKVNGHTFTLEGNYPEAAPFTTEAKFSTADLTFNGVPFSDDDGGGFEGEFNLDISAVGDLLDILKLKGAIGGVASLQTKITNRVGVTSLSDFSAVVELETGQRLSLEGDVADFVARKGIDLEFNARLFPENQRPAPAQDLADLKLTEVSTLIISHDNLLELDNLLISTNAFQHGLEKVGPVSIGRIHRTDEGTLAFEKIAMQAGPPDAPILVAHGNIFNVLELKDLDLEGNIDAPASIVLSGLGDDVADAFGGVQADFAVDDVKGAMSIKHLSARAVDTEIWAMQTDISVANVMTLGETVIDFDLKVENGAEFLSALNLTPVDTGPLNVGIAVSGNEGAWSGELGLGAGTSEMTASMSMARENDRKTINAAIVSEAMVINDLKNAVAGVIEVKKIGQQPAQENEASGAESDAPPGETSDIELQPLVLPIEAKAETLPAPQEPANDVELQPLVIASEQEKLLDVNDFLRETDIYGKIDFKKISGIDGVTHVSSEFVSEGGKARIGPLEFNYGGGYFNFQAAMDVVEAPRFVSVSGATSGWNLADILKTAGVKFDANGNLSGQFNVAGNLTTIESFINTVRGNASVYMSNGQVATSLLELAGLGVFPWLFSQERRQGYTDITCVSLPVRINPGSVTFDSAVAETSSVQLVAKGAVDWAGDAISIRAEPRPLGRPLARSAWPFNVSGKLSNPRFKLDVGGSRSRRADGADKMPADRKPCRADILQLQ